MILRDTRSLVDIHNHLVPGVDDGARSVDAVLQSVERMMRAGIRRIVTTPHVQGSLAARPRAFEERMAEVDEAFEMASEAIHEAFPEVEYRRGHEVLVDLPEIDLSDDRLRLAGTAFVLIEWPRLQIPPGTPRVVEQMAEQGYRPVIAHPERYFGLMDDFDLARRWRDAGALLQVNYGSLVGRYGAGPQVVAFRILRSGLASYLASDFHGHASLKLYKEEAEAALETRDASSAFDFLARLNPSRLLEGEEPMAVPPLPEDPTLFRRIRGMIKRQNA